MSVSAVTERQAGDPGALAALRALQVLEHLAGMEQPASLPAVASRAHLSKSKAYRALRALQDAGFVDHVGRGGYRVGGRSTALASLIGSRPAVLQRARPVLIQLADLACAGAALSLRSGAHRVIVMGVVSSKALSGATPSPVPVGERAPLTSGCGGTAILAHLSQAEADAVISSRPPESRDQVPRSSHASAPMATRCRLAITMPVSMGSPFPSWIRSTAPPLDRSVLLHLTHSFPRRPCAGSVAR